MNIELLIHVVLVLALQMHANGVSPTSFGPSSLPILLHDSSESALVPTMGRCLKHNLDFCKQKREEIGDLAYERCVEYSFIHCLDHVQEEGDPVTYSLIKNCAGGCVKEAKKYRLVLCLLDCYSEHVEKPATGIETPPSPHEHIESPPSPHEHIRNPPKHVRRPPRAEGKHLSMPELLKKLQNRFNRHSDVVYTQNPWVSAYLKFGTYYVSLFLSKLDFSIFTLFLLGYL
jgi:hypothetical protein